MDAEKIKNAKKFYNTDIVCRTKRELVNLGYISIRKLPVQLSKEKLIGEARMIHNSIALYSWGYMTTFIKQSVFNIFILKNLKQQPAVEIIIKAEGNDFIDQLIKFLSSHPKANFEIIPKSELRTSLSDEDKINFLSLRIGDTGLSVRSRNILKVKDVQYVFQICGYSINDLFAVRNFGEKSLAELKQCFANRGLIFGEVPQHLIEKARELYSKK